LFFVHSTLRYFILCFHLHPLFSFLIASENLLLVRVTLWKLAWYYHNGRLADRCCTALPRLLRTLILAHSFTLHFSHFTSYSSPSSFLGDSSQSSPCFGDSCDDKLIPSPRGTDAGLVNDNSRPPEALCLMDSRRNPNRLMLITIAENAITTILSGGYLSPYTAVFPDPVVTPLVFPTLSAFSYISLALP